jgi:hypothetical protein
MVKTNLKFLVLLLMLSCSTMVLQAQQVGIKTNFAYWATTTPNLGVEFSTGQKATLELAGGMNPFTFSDNKKIKHWLFQPEFRLWPCEKFNGHFFGIHAHAAQFNVGGLDIPIGRLDVFKDSRYEGYL